MSSSQEKQREKPRGVLIAGNWKMNQTRSETERFFSALYETLGSSTSPGYSSSNHPIRLGSLKACIIPPFIYLETARHQASRFPFPLAVGAQNGHWEKKGAFTGEISGPMLQELGIDWVLVGHSERRQYFGETDRSVRLRASSLLEQGFKVILCVGETREEREQGKTAEVLTRQVQEALSDSKSGTSLKQYCNGQLVLAYEPVWAIGTGLTATPAQAEESHQLIRKLIWELMGMEAAGRTPILYGGSATPENIDALLSCPNVDGALVGGASLKPESFSALLQGGARALGFQN